MQKRRKVSKAAVIAALAAVMSLSIAACGSDDDDGAGCRGAVEIRRSVRVGGGIWAPVSPHASLIAAFQRRSPKGRGPRMPRLARHRSRLPRASRKFRQWSCAGLPCCREAPHDRHRPGLHRIAAGPKAQGPLSGRADRRHRGASGDPAVHQRGRPHLRPGRGAPRDRDGALPADRPAGEPLPARGHQRRGRGGAEQDAAPARPGHRHLLPALRRDGRLQRAVLGDLRLRRGHRHAVPPAAQGLPGALPAREPGRRRGDDRSRRATAASRRPSRTTRTCSRTSSAASPTASSSAGRRRTRPAASTATGSW